MAVAWPLVGNDAQIIPYLIEAEEPVEEALLVLAEDVPLIPQASVRSLPSCDAGPHWRLGDLWPRGVISAAICQGPFARQRRHVKRYQLACCVGHYAAPPKTCSATESGCRGAGPETRCPGSIHPLSLAAEGLACESVTASGDGHARGFGRDPPVFFTPSSWQTSNYSRDEAALRPLWRAVETIRGRSPEPTIV